jgi:hypothetical protein
MNDAADHRGLAVIAVALEPQRAALALSGIAYAGNTVKTC